METRRNYGMEINVGSNENIKKEGLLLITVENQELKNVDRFRCLITTVTCAFTKKRLLSISNLSLKFK